MRTIQASKVTEVIRKLCIEANCHLSADLKDRIVACRGCETFPVAQGILDPSHLQQAGDDLKLV